MIILRLQAAWARVRNPWKLGLLATIAIVAAVLGFLIPSPYQAGKILPRYGYFVMLVTFAWWSLSLIRVGWGASLLRGVFPVAKWKPHRAAFLIIAAFTVISWFVIEMGHKILYDEHVLQSTALNLHFFREFGTVARAYDVEGVFRPVATYLDKRPFFSPFSVSLVHDLTGYRPANAFLLNMALMPVVLGLMYVIVRTLSGGRAALVALACFAASPLLMQNAGGAGMEMLNLMMILLTLILSIGYLKNPGAGLLSGLVLTCVLLAQTRYESGIYVGCTGLVILEGWRRAGRIIFSPALLMAPLLLVPCALHHVYVSGSPLLWELKDAPARFSPIFLGKNLTSALTYFYIPSRTLYNNVWWLSVAGTVAGVMAVVAIGRNLQRWRTWSAASTAVFLVGLGALGNFVVLMFYYWGQLTDPQVWRLALPLYAVLAVAVGWAMNQFRDSWRVKLCHYTIVGACLGFLSVGSTDRGTVRWGDFLIDEIERETRWVQARPSGTRLVISNKSSLNWMIHRIPAILTGQVQDRIERLRFHLEAGTFREILVIQYYWPEGRDGDFIIDPQDVMPGRISMEPLDEWQSFGRLVRISRIVKITPPEKPDIETKAKAPEIKAVEVPTQGARS